MRTVETFESLKKLARTVHRIVDNFVMFLGALLLLSASSTVTSFREVSIVSRSGENNDLAGCVHCV